MPDNGIQPIGDPVVERIDQVSQDMTPSKVKTMSLLIDKNSGGNREAINRFSCSGLIAGEVRMKRAVLFFCSVANSTH